MPLQAYQFFINKFLDAIRYEIARSAERAYESLSLKDMSQMFMIESDDDLAAFIRGNDKKEGCVWNLDLQSKRVFFTTERVEKKEIPAEKMILLSLEYATELNRII